MKQVTKETRITVSVGCTDYLVDQVESLRRQNEVLSAEKRIVDNFFGMINRLEGKQPQGYSQDQLSQAKQEIKSATEKACEVKNATK